MTMKVYFDNAATTRPRPEVIRVMTQALEEYYGNPSSTHGVGRAAKTQIEQARKSMAAMLNCSPSELIFTSGGTETDNMVLRTAVRDLGVKRIITAATEHHAILHAAHQLEKEYGIRVDLLQLDPKGMPSLDHLEVLLQEELPTLVSVMHINNEIGNRIDIDKLAQISKAAGAYVHTDAVQSVGHWEWDLQRTRVDFLAAAAHKFHGPKGIGLAFIRKDIPVKPMIFGGEQEKGFRAGTESLHNILGMEVALRLSTEQLAEERAYIEGLKMRFIAKLNESLPGVKFNGYCEDQDRSTYNLLNVCLPLPAELAPMLAFQLDLKGIACSRGSACQSGSSTASHVLAAFLPEEDLARPSLRFSFSIYNTEAEVDYVTEVLAAFAKTGKLA